MSALQNEILVIGFGSSLRGDDAVGRLVGELIADRALPNVIAISVTQLVPELAVRISKAQAVIFVDACVNDNVRSFEVQEMTCAAGVVSTSHTAAPRELLALASACFDRTPPAWLVAVPAATFEMTDQLSSTARQNARSAARAIERLVNELRENEVAHA